MAVPPRLPNLAPGDMQWVRWATEELKSVSGSQRILGSNVAAAQQQAASAHTATSAVIAKTAAQEAVNPSLPKGPPQVPSTPSLSTDHGTVTIKWDGLVFGNGDGNGSLMEPAIGFNHVAAERGTSANGPWTPVGGFIRKMGSIVDTDVTVGTTYWYHFITTDNADATSAPGGSQSVLVKGVDLGSLDSDVTQALADAADAAAAGLAAGQAGQQAAADALAASNTVAGQAADALQAANDAQSTAQSALAAAQEAAGGAASVVISSTAPPADGAVLWIDTTGGANTPKRYNTSTSAWVAITDKTAVDAANAAVLAQNAANAAQTTANSAVTAAQNAQASANTAQTTADGKNTVFYQTSAPATSGRKNGDIWFDTDDGYKLYVWNGAWTATQFGSSAIAPLAITATQLANGSVSGTQLATSVNTSITTAQTTANTAVTNAGTAQTAANNAKTAADAAAATAAGKSTVVYSTTAPTGDATVLWIDTTNSANTPKRWNGTAWVVITDKAATDAAAAASAANTLANTANNTANTANTNAQNAATAASTAQTAANNAQSQANTATTNAATAQSAADSANTAALNAAGIANGKGKVWYQTTAPTGNVNDLWIDTTNNANTPKRYNGTAWVAVTDKAATDAATAAATANSAAQAAQTQANTATTNAATAQTAANNAQTAANAAQTTANSASTAAATAQTTANGKNTVSYSTNTPVSTYTGRAGDVWFTQDGTGAVTGHYVWSGSAWITQTLTNTVIANLDAGKISTGILAAARIGANSIAANQMVTGTITAASAILAAASVTTANIQDLAVTSAKITALDAGKITTGTLDANRIGANSIAASQMIAGTITAASGIIADAAIVTAKIANLAVGTAQIAALAVSDAKINDLNGNKIQAATIVAGKLSADAVTTNNILAGAIDTNRLAAGAITADKISLGSVSQSSPTERLPQPLDNNLFWGKALATAATFTGVNQGLANATASNGTYGAGLTVNNGGYAFLMQQAPVPASRKLMLYGTTDDGTGVFTVRQFTTATSYTDSTVAVNPNGNVFNFASNALTYYVYITSTNGRGYQRFINARIFEVIGGVNSGQAAQLSPNGLQLFDTNGSLAVDLTTNAAQYLTIYDATASEPDAVAAIDQFGNGAFTEISADLGFDIQGLPLTDTNNALSLFNSTPNGSAWNPDTPLLDRLARGVIYDVTWQSLNDYAVAANKPSLRIAQDVVILEDGRQYMWHLESGGLQMVVPAGNSNMYFELQVSLSPITSIGTGVNISRGMVPTGGTASFVTQSPIFTASVNTSAIDNEARIMPAGVPIYWQLDCSSGGAPNAWKLSEFGYSRGLTIVDMGANDIGRPINGADSPNYVDSRVQFSAGGTAAAGAGSTGTSSTSKTITFTAKSSRTWNNGGSIIVSGSGQYTNGAAMYVGTGSSSMGSWFGNFQTVAGTSMFSVLSGKTVTAATLTLKNNYTYSSSGSTNTLGTGASSTAPATIGTPANNTFSVKFAQGATKSIALSSAIRSGLSSGGVQAFVIGVQSGAAGVYGYFAGATQSSPPKLVVTYH